MLNGLNQQHCLKMYAFSPPNMSMSCNTTFHHFESRSSRSTLGAISMHTSQHKHNSPEKKIPTSSSAVGLIPPSPLLGKTDTYNNIIGIIGGVSVFSTLIFLEKLVWWSSRQDKDCVPFIVCSDPCLSREFHRQNVVSSFYGRNDQFETEQLSKVNNVIIENLRQKMEFLEGSGARCIVMPCHLSHSWYKEISQGCSLPFLHLGDCVAKQLMSLKLEPLEAGGKIRIGLISTYAIMQAGFYQERLQEQGFEVLLPDRATMDHILLPAIAALRSKDVEGGRNLLRIAISILLMRGANMVVIASDKLQGLLPSDDPLVKKCIDPNDALAKCTISWSQSVPK